MKILLSISYDGTSYNGWQRQNDFRSVQGEIEKALTKIYDKDIKILGASRTDASVHALDQIAVFTIESSNIPPEKLYILLNKNLPDDITIKKSMVVNDMFHPMAHVLKKTYTFTLDNGEYRNPIHRNHATYVKNHLDDEKMNLAIKEFIGTYDFYGFCKNASKKDNTVRTIYDAFCYREGDFVYFSITGNGFLHNMVRTICGTLIDVGHDKIAISDVKNIILSKNRTKSSKTVNGNGLCLQKIYVDTSKLH